MARTTLYEKCIDKWTPRVGRRAAVLRAGVERDRDRVRLITLSPWLTLGTGTLAHLPAVTAFGYATLVPAALYLARSLRDFRRFRSAAGECLGIPLSSKECPPRRADRYEAWCASKGLVPYAAREPGSPPT